MDLFETFLKHEEKSGSIDASRVLLDCFSYCLRSNHMMALFYIITKFSSKFVVFQTEAIDALLNDIKEYTETDGCSHYHNGVFYLEEKLFLLEMMIDHSTKQQASLFN
jgi:hypothetical protein